MSYLLMTKCERNISWMRKIKLLLRFQNLLVSVCEAVPYFAFCLYIFSKSQFYSFCLLSNAYYVAFEFRIMLNRNVSRDSLFELQISIFTAFFEDEDVTYNKTVLSHASNEEGTMPDLKKRSFHSNYCYYMRKLLLLYYY